MKRVIFFISIIFFFKISISTAQGPNAPEAGSFEPVDATDMVNLVTGDFTYVLPLLNIPSPEGGYPIALSYHAGIAMDQEASWTGLGWNLNPGAINRSVNGYPDDYNNSLLSEYFFDEGDEVTIFSLSLGFGSNKGLSVGLGFSWGSHKSLGGTVSIGYSPTEIGGGIGGGISVGENGVGLNGSYGFKGGHTLGVSLNSRGNIIGSYGFDTNSAGFGISSNGTFKMNINHKSGNGNAISTGISLSSNGLSINGGVTNKTRNVVDGGAGTGLSVQFENTVRMGDYTSKTSGWSIPIMIPTKIGVFSLTFGKQKFKYWLGKNEYNFVSGPIYFNKEILNTERYKVIIRQYAGPSGCVTRDEIIMSSYQEAQDYILNNPGEANCPNSIMAFDTNDAFMDIYEVPLNNNEAEFTLDTELNNDNATFPTYDKYNVQAQGLSGSMSSRLFENGNLFGLSNRENNQGYKLSYSIDGSSTTIPVHAKFNQQPFFYFDNEISTYLAVNEASFNTITNNPAILDYYSNGVDSQAEQRRKNANYINYYTVEDLLNNYNNIKAEGYLKPNVLSGFSPNQSYLPEDGIAAFKITSADGKTYHYSLPVYNHEIVTRTHGSIVARQEEHESYFEKRQLEPYATHWLLTAITGPDYFDYNDNGIADKGDYGYWTTFEYGKWSDAFAWKTPYGQDYFKNDDDPNIKTQVRGRKQIYYLDRIKTKTHTALFVKSERNDAKSIEWAYRSVEHEDDLEQSYANYQSLPLRFTIPSQKSLRLEKILLIKEEDDIFNLSFGGASESQSVDVLFNNSNKPLSPAWYNLKGDIIDIGDSGLSTLESKALKVINFKYDYSLVKGSPNTTSNNIGRLTLKSVGFTGKANEEILPPYVFDYNNTWSTFNIEDEDDFGYHENDNRLWSLNEITTPIGGKIQINYENHSFKSVVSHSINKFIGDGGTTFGTNNQPPTNQEWYFGVLNVQLSGNEIFTPNIGDNVLIDFKGYNNNSHWYGYEGYGQVTSISGNMISILPPQNATLEYLYQNQNSCYPYGVCWHRQVKLSFLSTPSHFFTGGGIRVSELIINSDINSYKTKYSYGNNQDGIGYISFLPYAPKLEKELPYSSELPSPKVMYEYVEVESFGTDNLSNGKSRYKFKVLKEKDANLIKFGDLYEIETYAENQHYNSIADKDVEIKSYRIHDNLASLGQLLEISSFNSQNQLLSKIENSYYSPDYPTPSNVGKTKESYQTYKEIDYIAGSQTDKWLINSSSRIKYPSLLKSSTEYKSGYKFISEFGELDQITGQALEVNNSDSQGNKYKTQSVPAYHITEYNPSSGYGMGSKVDDPTNKNMLTQQAMSKSFIEVDGVWKETGVGITTWNNNWIYHNQNNSTNTISGNSGVWRKHKNFIWDGDLAADGTYDGFSGEDDNFNWDLGTIINDSFGNPTLSETVQTNPEWKNVSTITKYDRFSLPLESRDINGNFSTSKMADDDSKAVLSANAGFGEVFFSGAEYTDNYGITLGGIRQTNGGHTGSCRINVDEATAFTANMRSGNHRAGRYRISVWVKNYAVSSSRVRINGSTTTFNGEQVTAGDWTLLSHYANLSTSAQTIQILATGSASFDDFRIHPDFTSMNSYVYNKWDELEAILGPNNLATKFEYDSQGRLVKTYNEIIDANGNTGGFKLSSENDYNYKYQEQQ